MVVLAVECSTPTGSICLCEDFKVLHSVRWKRKRSHGEVLSPHIDEALKSQGLVMGDINHFAVGIGPGSFTGIRVALASVKALAYATGKKVFVLDSLRILAEGIHTSTSHLVCVQNAYSNLMYIAEYEPNVDNNKRRWREIRPPSLVTGSSLTQYLRNDSLVAGDLGFLQTHEVEGVNRPNEPDEDRVAFPLASTLCQLATDDTGDNLKSWRDVRPLYIRASAAEEKLNKGLLKPIK